jgi:molybdopterin/thiamine biosynthesis adenylyltransferase
MLISGGERQRYDCQLVLKEVGERGQDQLRRASVLVVGAGGLGPPALYYLTAAGVGHIGVADDDVVELSNLQRQVLYTTEDVGKGKASCAAARLRALNPEARIDTHERRLTAANAREVIAGYDVVVTAVDNFPTRYLLNDACVLLRKTLVDGAVLRLTGLAMTIKGGETTCYRCLFPEPPPPAGVVSCSEAGVLGPIPGTIGAIQALEAIKVITGAGRPLYDRLLQFDGGALTFQEIQLSRVPDCPVCGEHPTVTELVDYDAD